jgi:hypothetical protein
MTAITVRATPCWTLVHADGRPAGFEDSKPHFDTEADALKAAPGYGDVDIPAPTAKSLAGLCATATTVCGYTYDEDGEGVEHWPDAAALRRHLTAAGWRFAPGGEMRCPAGHGCVDCDAAPDSPDLTRLPGQLDLITGAEVIR